MPPLSEPESSPEPSEAELIMHLARHLRRSSATETAAWGISPHQVRALSVVARHRDGVRLGTLAERLQVAPRSATDVVDALEGLGLVHREPDPEDRRAVRVGLTERGRQVAGEIRTARTARGDAVLATLGTQERTRLRRTLTTLLEAARSAHDHTAYPAHDPAPDREP